MHEHGIADRLLEEARSKAEKQGLSQIALVVIGLGALSGLSQESMLEPLQHVAEHLGWRGLAFQFKKIAPRAKCRNCGRDIGEEYACPACGGMDVEVTAGLDAEVLEVL